MIIVRHSKSPKFGYLLKLMGTEHFARSIRYVIGGIAMLNRFILSNLHSSLVLLTASSAISCLALPNAIRAQDTDGAGAVISGKASVQDVGLPIYPGSKPHKDKDDDSTAANLGLWGGGSGFKLVVLKMESGDSPEKIIGFYKRALSKYGPVLDCSNPTSDKSSKDDSKTLTCGGDKADKGGYLFKSGTKERQHMVEIRPSGQGTLYTLLNLGAWSAK
jgi:hypothetical protein